MNLSGYYIKHEKTLDVAWEVTSCYEQDDHYSLIVRVWNQGFVLPYLINREYEVISIKKSDILNWYLAQDLKENRSTEWQRIK